MVLSSDLLAEAKKRRVAGASQLALRWERTVQAAQEEMIIVIPSKRHMRRTVGPAKHAWSVSRWLELLLSVDGSLLASDWRHGQTKKRG